MNNIVIRIIVAIVAIVSFSLPAFAQQQNVFVIVGNLSAPAPKASQRKVTPPVEKKEEVKEVKVVETVNLTDTPTCTPVTPEGASLERFPLTEGKLSDRQIVDMDLKVKRLRYTFKAYVHKRDEHAKCGETWKPEDLKAGTYVLVGSDNYVAYKLGDGSRLVWRGETPKPADIAPANTDNRWFIRKVWDGFWGLGVWPWHWNWQSNGWPWHWHHAFWPAPAVHVVTGDGGTAKVKSGDITVDTTGRAHVDIVR